MSARDAWLSLLERQEELRQAVNALQDSAGTVPDGQLWQAQAFVFAARKLLERLVDREAQEPIQTNPSRPRLWLIVNNERTQQ